MNGIELRIGGTDYEYLWEVGKPFAIKRSTGAREVVEPGRGWGPRSESCPPILGRCSSSN